MQAIEVTGEINPNGDLLLDQPLQATPGRVRVIVLLSEASEQTAASSAALSPEEIQPQSANSQPAQPDAVVSDTRPIWERITDISAQIPAEEWAKLPRDLSKNIDHYLYDSPKDE